MDIAEANAYLTRIGATRPAQPTGPTVAALRELHLAHLRTVPFENLSVHLGEDIVLEEKALLAKLVGARRGGLCYELNGGFAALLAALGYDVSMLSARVFLPDGRLSPPYDHMTLRVAATDDPRPWLADVGFGRNAHYPLRYDERGEQQDPDGVFRIADAPGGDLDVLRDGRPAYRFEQRPCELGEFEAMCWYQRTSPKSHFTQSLTCSRLTESGRVTLSGDVLIETPADGGARTERTLAAEEILPAYREHFGIGLDRIPSVNPPFAS